MKRCWSAIFFSIIASPSLWAFPCFLTLAKNNCWIDYTVSVEVINTQTGNVVTRAVVPKGQSWTRQPFTCNPSESFMYQARFSPVIWASGAGMSYHALHYVVLPPKPQKQETGWELRVCYSDDFAETPLPPTAQGQCSCDFSSIPPVPPQ